MTNPQDKAYLIKDIQKKINTATIGALSKFEMFFGVIWGHGKQDHELEENEAEWREMWMQCRNEILDNGNNQGRLAQQSLNGYNIDKEKKSISVGQYVDGKYVPTKHPIILEQGNKGGN